MDHFSVKKKENWAYKLKCYRKVLKIPWTRKVKSIDILWDINTRENWLLTSITTRKFRCCGHVKRYSGRKRTVMEDVVFRKRDRCEECGGGYRTLKTP